MKFSLQALFIVEALLIGGGAYNLDQVLADFDDRRHSPKDELRHEDQVWVAYTAGEGLEEVDPPRPIQSWGRVVLAFLVGIIFISKMGIYHYLLRPIPTVRDLLGRSLGAA